MNKKDKNYFFNKTVAITGASSGLGKELAYRFADYEMQIFLIARKEKSPTTDRKKNSIQNSQAIVIAMDISEEENCQKIVEILKEKSERLDFLFLNAGMSMWDRFSEIKEVSYFEKLMQINYLSNVFLLHYGLHYFKKKRTKIIFTLSIQAHIGVPYHTGYVATKHAMDGFIKTLALEETIEIIKIIPGWIRGTNLRMNAIKCQNLNTKIPISSHKNNHFLSISLSKAASIVLKKMRQNKDIIYIPKTIQWVYQLNRFFPKWIQKKLKSHPQRKKNDNKTRMQ